MFTVFRYENAEGKGPYHAPFGKENEWMNLKLEMENLHADRLKWPGWRFDFREFGIFQPWSWDEPEEQNWVAGFATRQQAIKWFGKFSRLSKLSRGRRTTLEDCGFNLVGYQTNTVEFGKSGKQIRFLKE